MLKTYAQQVTYCEVNKTHHEHTDPVWLSLGAFTQFEQRSIPAGVPGNQNSLVLTFLDSAYEGYLLCFYICISLL